MEKVEYYNDNNENGRKEWRQNGLLHRDNGPAIIREDGTREWYKKGHRHRIDRAAIEWTNGFKFW